MKLIRNDNDNHACEGAKTQYVSDPVQIRSTYYSITVEAVERMLRPWLYQDWIYYRTRRGQRFKKHVETAHKLTTKVIIQLYCYYYMLQFSD